MKQLKTDYMLALSYIVMVLGISLIGCKKWEYNVEKNGLYFKKICESKSGIIGYLSEQHKIQGFDCEKGWIHFRKDWKLKSFQLSKDFSYKNILMPSNTWIHFPHSDDKTGFIVSLPYDYEIQGHVCGGSGGYKGTHTGFYDSGRLRSFYPPEDIVVKGVPCKSSLFVNVCLHENGNLKSCRLANDYTINGNIYKKGKIIEFDTLGNVK